MTTTIQQQASRLAKELTYTNKSYTMGYQLDLRVICKDGTELRASRDCREFYEGRGSKYNSSIRHGYQLYTMTESEVKKEASKLFKEDKISLKNKIDADKRQAKYAAALDKAVKSILKQSGTKKGITKIPKFFLGQLDYNISIVADKPQPNTDQPYYINTYHGCGVYRVWAVNSKIVATLYEGFHHYVPSGMSKSIFIDMVQFYIQSRLDYHRIEGELSHGIKMDGSGCQFFVRCDEDSIFFETTKYIVPAPYGNGNFGFANQNIQAL